MNKDRKTGAGRQVKEERGRRLRVREHGKAEGTRRTGVRGRG